MSDLGVSVTEAKEFIDNWVMHKRNRPAWLYLNYLVSQGYRLETLIPVMIPTSERRGNVDAGDHVRVEEPMDYSPISRQAEVEDEFIPVPPEPEMERFLKNFKGRIEKDLLLDEAKSWLMKYCDLPNGVALGKINTAHAAGFIEEYRGDNGQKYVHIN